MKDKKKNVIDMFDKVAKRYDFLNHLLSFGLDFGWRKKAVKRFEKLDSSSYVMDLCSGTGDMTFSLIKNDGFRGRSILIDGSMNMLRIARRKAEREITSSDLNYILADAEHLPIGDKFLDAAMIAFGIRNLADPVAGLREIFRVLKPGGEFIVLEFTMPDSWVFRRIYLFYFTVILPFIGGIISKKSAYRYLPGSVLRFDNIYDLKEELTRAGFTFIQKQKMGFGIVILWYSRKPLK